MQRAATATQCFKAHAPGCFREARKLTALSEPKHTFALRKPSCHNALACQTLYLGQEQSKCHTRSTMGTAQSHWPQSLPSQVGYSCNWTAHPLPWPLHQQVATSADGQSDISQCAAGCGPVTPVYAGRSVCKPLDWTCIGKPDVKSMHRIDHCATKKKLLLTVCICGLDWLRSLCHSIQDSPSTIAISIWPHQTQQWAVTPAGARCPHGAAPPR